MSKELIDNAKDLREIGEGIREPICFAAADELESLRAQLKEAQAEIERLKSEAEMREAGKRSNIRLAMELTAKDAEIEKFKAYYAQVFKDGERQIQIHKENAAASQANEVQLRDGIKNLGELAQALDSCGSVADSPKSVWAQSEVMTEFAQKLLSLPSDTTALEAMIKKAGEVMRERCAEWLDERVYYRRESEAIRAIPGVTLEDLK